MFTVIPLPGYDGTLASQVEREARVMGRGLDGFVTLFHVLGLRLLQVDKLVPFWHILLFTLSDPLPFSLLPPFMLFLPLYILQLPS